MSLSIYRSLVRPLLFRMDAEKAHDLTIGLCEKVGGIAGLRSIVARVMTPEADALLHTSFAGLSLNSPIALGAGFDKNGRALGVLSSVGFGAIEIGAVSMQPCAGNAGCRAVRLVGEKAVLTRYGVPNDGVERIVPRFARHVRTVPVGVNVIWNSTGKPDSSIHEVVADMADGLASFEDLVDYATLNFACPNIRGESHFNDIDNVRLLFEQVDQRRPTMPVLLKFRHRPDVRWIDDLVSLSLRYPWVGGFIPIAHVMRPMGQGAAPVKGSISGAPLKDETVDIVRLWYSRIDRERHALVATGGITTPEDAFEAMAAGATVVQVFTTMIYNGPGVAREMSEGLARMMRAAGLASTADLTGSEARTRRMPADLQPA